MKAGGAAHRRALRQSNPQQLIWGRAKARAQKLGRAFSITLDDIVIPEFCPWLGIKLAFADGKPGPNSPALDRKDNRKGYVPGNVEVISQRANMLKSNCTMAEIARMGERARSMIS